MSWRFTRVLAALILLFSLASCGEDEPVAEPEPVKAAWIHPQEFLEQVKGIGSLSRAPSALSPEEAVSLFMDLEPEWGLEGFSGLPGALGASPIALRIKIADAAISILAPGLPVLVEFDALEGVKSPGILTAFDGEARTGSAWVLPPSTDLAPREGTLFNVTVITRRIVGASLVPRESIRGAAGARVLRTYNPETRRIEDQGVTVLMEEGPGLVVAPAPAAEVLALMTPQKPGVVPGDQIVEPVDPLAVQAKVHWSDWIKDVERNASRP